MASTSSGRKRKLADEQKTARNLSVVHLEESDASSEAFIEGLKERIAPDRFNELFEYLLDNKTDQFFRHCWEQKPCYFSRKAHSQVVLSELLSKKVLTDIVKERVPLPFDGNFNVLRYDGVDRELWPADSEHFDAEDLKQMFAEGFTVQFYQPQRFSDGLFFINASFEKYFQTLAGASAYLTPPSSQGLAPHWDDVEVFVLQTEGTKTWHLWPAPMLLAENHSNSILRNDLPNVMDEVVLHPGDLLYLPRGTIHEAISTDLFSTHVTISVFQKRNVKNILLSAISKALDSAFVDNLELRKGLDLNFGSNFGSFNRDVVLAHSALLPLAESEAMKAKRENFTVKLQNLVLSSIVPKITESLIDECFDEMSEDFVRNRLPPPDVMRDDEDDAFEDAELDDFPFKISEDDHIRLCDPSNIFALVQMIEGVQTLALAHNLDNNRFLHMGHPSAALGGVPFGNCNGKDSGSHGVSDDENSEEEYQSKGSGQCDINEDNHDDSADCGLVSLFLPLRFGPILLKLKEAFVANTYITARDILAKFSDKYDLGEILDACSQLKSAGFLNVKS